MPALTVVSVKDVIVSSGQLETTGVGVNVGVAFSMTRVGSTGVGVLVGVGVFVGVGVMVGVDVGVSVGVGVYVGVAFSMIRVFSMTRVGSTGVGVLVGVTSSTMTRVTSIGVLVRAGRGKRGTNRLWPASMRSPIRQLADFSCVTDAPVARPMADKVSPRRTI